jgi:hypothetical protein
MRIFKIIYEYKGLNDSEIVYGNNKPEALRKFIKGQNLTDLIILKIVEWTTLQ